MEITKIKPAEAMDELVAVIRPVLKAQGFRVRGRTFNRRTPDGLTHVVQFQMGRYDPPGTTFIPGLREDLYGRFTVNVGVYVPEVHKMYFGGSGEKDFVPEVDCCVRNRIGRLGPRHEDLWWLTRVDDQIVEDLRKRLERDVLPFLARFENRDALLDVLAGSTETSAPGGPPMVVRAIVLATRGQSQDARLLLQSQVRQASKPEHTRWVQGLAARLGLGTVD